MTLREGFRIGVATSGFQIEGGYNGPSQPANNWERWERQNRVERSGPAIRFWDRYTELLDRAVDLGCNTIRLSIEWARCEPSRSGVDQKAISRYREILAACHARRLEPLVTLHHFTHPAWLGEDFWLDLGSPEAFAGWVRAPVESFGDQCRAWVTLNEPNVLALQTYVTGMFPPGRRMATGHAVRALDHLVAAHALAYVEIKRLQPDAHVATNMYAFTAYELDRLIIDLLLHPSRGIDQRHLRDHLGARREQWYAAFPAPTIAERGIRHFTRSGIPLDQALPRAQAAVRAAERATLDAIQVDFYDARASNHLRLPGHRTAGGRHWLPGRMLWDDAPDPALLARYCRAVEEPGIPIEIVENGMCNRVTERHSFERLDGWDRPRYLRAHADAVSRLVEAGAPITGYWHWTLADNYEWGSYEPRFGIFGVDRRDPDDPRLTDLDAMGRDSAAAFREAFGTEAA